MPRYYYQIQEERTRLIHVWISWLVIIALFASQIIAFTLIPSGLVLAIVFFIVGLSCFALVAVLNYVTNQYLDDWFDASAVGLISLSFTLASAYVLTGQTLPPTNAHLIAALTIVLSFVPLVSLITLPLSVFFYFRRVRKRTLISQLGRRL